MSLSLSAFHLSGILRSMYSSNRKPHQLAYLLLLHAKKDLSIAELDYFMQGMPTPNGKPCSYQTIYGHMYALEKKGYVRHERMIGEEGKSCNIYYITPLGTDIIRPVLSLGRNWDTVKKSFCRTALFKTVQPKPKQSKISKIYPETESHVQH